MKNLLSLFFALLFIIGCVPKKKYEELLRQKLALEADKADCISRFDSLNKVKEQLLSDTSRLFSGLTDTKSLLGDEKGKNESLRAELKKVIDKLNKETGQFTVGSPGTELEFAL